jgi:hypothetical protein
MNDTDQFTPPETAHIGRFGILAPLFWPEKPGTWFV